MKFLNKSIRTQIAWLSCLLFFGVLFISAISHKQSSNVLAMEIQVNGDKNKKYLITTDEVRKRIRSLYERKIVGMNVKDVDVKFIENELKRTSFIKEAEVFLDSNNYLEIEIKQRIPIARIFDNAGGSYYIESEGSVMPVSRHYTARVPVFTGRIPSLKNANDNVRKDLYHLAQALRNDAFANALVEQVTVTDEARYVLHTKLGDEKIHLGKLDDLRYKLKKLKAFYKKPLAAQGLNKYDTIHLDISNQVYATK